MKIFTWIKERVKHKLEHLSFSKLKDAVKKHGMPFLVILVGWEIIEDVLFPVAFGLLGKYIHPAFYGGIPAAWLLCLHWLAVPVLWHFWLKVSGNKLNSHATESCDHNH